MNHPNAALHRIRALLMFIALLFSGSLGVAQDDYKEDVPAYNDLVARTFLIEVEPLVEKFTGWECEWPVAFQLVSRAQYVEESIVDAAKELKKLEPGLDQKLVGTQFRSLFEAQAIGLLGRYSTTSRKIFFLPGNLKPMMRELGIEHRFMRDLIEVIMAHELTHYVQDSKYNFGERFRTLRSKEENKAWMMLIEGHASWVQERVAEALGLDESAQRFAQQMLAKHQQQGGQGSEGLFEANMRGYIQGKVFVEAVHEKGGIKAVQRLFDNPPKSPGLIEDPDLYLLQLEKKKP
jgi:hypothetical protein